MQKNIPQQNSSPIVSLALSNLTPIRPPSTSPPQTPISRPLSVSTPTSTTLLPSPPTPQASVAMPRFDLPADENVDLEELEQFAKEFKQRRIKLGKNFFLFMLLIAPAKRRQFMSQEFILKMNILHTVQAI
jgi:hypothetical protein